jgi:hypothetical protein
MEGIYDEEIYFLTNYSVYMSHVDILWKEQGRDE